MVVRDCKWGGPATTALGGRHVTSCKCGCNHGKLVVSGDSVRRNPRRASCDRRCYRRCRRRRRRGRHREHTRRCGGWRPWRRGRWSRYNAPSHILLWILIGPLEGCVALKLWELGGGTDLGPLLNFVIGERRALAAQPTMRRLRLIGSWPLDIETPGALPLR
jgi:hypothetical protein